MSKIQEYLQQLVDFQLAANNSERSERIAYYGSMDVIAKHGRAWTGWSTVKAHRGRAKQCFANSQRLAVRRPELTYVEGYAMSVIPLHHAWCVDNEGHVLDVTWERRDPQPEYFGVPIQREYIMQLMMRARCWTSVFDNWHDTPPQPIILGHHPPALWLAPWPPVAY